MRRGRETSAERGGVVGRSAGEEMRRGRETSAEGGCDASAGHRPHYQSAPRTWPSLGVRRLVQVFWLKAAVMLRTLPSMRATFMIA